MSPSLLLDEENELYGYAVVNVQKNCFVPLPDSLDSSTGSLAFPDHMVQEKDEEILEKVADFHDLDKVSHLRVVEVRLANELDESASHRFV